MPMGQASLRQQSTTRTQKMARPTTSSMEVRHVAFHSRAAQSCAGNIRRFTPGTERRTRTHRASRPSRCMSTTIGVIRRGSISIALAGSTDADCRPLRFSKINSPGASAPRPGSRTTWPHEDRAVGKEHAAIHGRVLLGVVSENGKQSTPSGLSAPRRCRRPGRLAGSIRSPDRRRRRR